ncbi:MAG: phosphorylcholine metabolism protein LicD [Harvfovirus sp.]|uniref:Phosphorylcholine metabolism protein LicD n=1 Tax=Harvfovirus sp. TaxID=2487768 RepID=A0A3G5A2H9_9VIRU|nr:MAG: phosphorylcholine metabolism protein LicD [Harvfovirus sp.]
MTLLLGLIFIFVIFYLITYNTRTETMDTIPKTQRRQGLIYTNPKTIYKLYKMIYTVTRILEIYNIQYWMDGGTLLGAVRHKGIIPWDEDADFEIFDSEEEKMKLIYNPLERFGYKMMATWWGFKIFPVDGAPIKGYKWKYPGLDIFVMEITKDKNDEDIIQYKYPMAKKIFGRCSLYYKDFYPLQDYKFGSFSLKGPLSTKRYLDNCYDTDWYDVAYMLYDHEHEKPYKKIKIKLTDEDRQPAKPFYIAGNK